METKKTSNDTAIQVASAILGTAHFILQSAADLTLSTEGKLVHKLSNGEISRKDIEANRRNTTQLRQLQLRNQISSIREQISKSAAPSVTPQTT